MATASIPRPPNRCPTYPNAESPCAICPCVRGGKVQCSVCRKDVCRMCAVSRFVATLAMLNGVPIDRVVRTCKRCLAKGAPS